VKILDLGLARLAEITPAANGDESTEVATLAAQSFHAPELAGKKQVTPLADVYSLGGILFYLLSGKSPLGNVKKAQDVKDACAAASDELTDLCARMLSEDPVARPQSARQVIEELEAAARAKPKPAAKEEKKASNGDKPQVKQKKPLVAKPLAIPFPTQAAAVPKSLPLAAESRSGDLADISLDDTNMVEQTQPVAEAAPAIEEAAPVSEPAAEDPFAGFTVQTKRKKQKPAAESSVVAPTPTKTPAAAAPSPNSGDAPAPVKSGKKPSLAIVLGVGIGGGVLILALGITVLIWVMSRGGKPVDKNAVAKADAKKAAATTPVEGNPEANPEANPEVNPEVDPAATTTPEKTTPAPTKEGPKTTVPMPMPNLPMPMPMPPATVPMPMPKPPEPVKPVPMPMPEPMVPVGNPFVGFAKVVTLPPLEEKGKPVADATKPFLLGTVKLPPKALCLVNLKGGDNAISTNAKQKFVMEAGNNGTSERDWDFKLVTEGANATVTVAKLSLQNDQLNFQWTDDATKQLNAAPYLCNCVLTMSAGSGAHALALRQPLTGEAMKIDLEKPMMAKFNVDYPPNPKQIVIQLGPPEGKFPKFKFEKAELTAKNDNTMFSTGPGDEVHLLHFKIISSMSGRMLKIDGQPNFKLHGMNKPEKYVKAKMNKLIPDTEAASQAAMQQQAQVNANINQIPPDRRPQAEAEMKKLVEDTATQKTQAVMLRDLVKDLQGDGKIHFHIFYEADTENKVVLVSTGAAPPMAPATP
ncbi:MAG: protein kinase domain-containing protein, partial [Pirellulaceae bacterium]